MKTHFRVLSAAIVVINVLPVCGQGTFQNLDFESATVPLSQPPSPNPGVPSVDITAALPGWSVFIGTNQASRVIAQSMQFKAKQVVFPLTSIAVSLDQQPVSAVPLQVTPQYALFGVDMTPFQNQTKELRFTVFSSGIGRGFVLDSISFSTQPIPEPSVLGLFALGAIVLGWRFVRARR